MTMLDMMGLVMMIREYFELPVSRFMTQNKSLEEWIEFGMEAQERAGYPFVWICNTNRGVAKVCRAALRTLGIQLEDIERDGYLGDPGVKGSLRILPRVGVWIRLTRNLDKARGFVNGALGQVVDVFRSPDFFSVKLISGTLVMVHPVAIGGEIFLPCVYGYAVTVRRTQGLTLHHGALFLDGRVYPRPRGHAYVAVSRFRNALGVYHYGPLRRSDWLPTAEGPEEQVQPSELSPFDWAGESEDSESSGAGFGANYREGLRHMSGGPCESESDWDESGDGGRSGGVGGHGSDASGEEEDPNAGICGGRFDSGSDSGSEVHVGNRCASPEPRLVLEDGSFEEELAAAEEFVTESDLESEAPEPKRLRVS